MSTIYALAKGMFFEPSVYCPCHLLAIGVKAALQITRKCYSTILPCKALLTLQQETCFKSLKSQRIAVSEVKLCISERLIYQRTAHNKLFSQNFPGMYFEN